MPKNNDIEKHLLTGKSIDELIKQKITDEITKEIETAKIAAKKVKITDFSKLPVAEIFSKDTCYLIFNRSTKRESFINGVQAEGFIGLKNDIREKLIKKEIDSFLTDDYFIKFDSAVVLSVE